MRPDVPDSVRLTPIIPGKEPAVGNIVDELPWWEKYCLAVPTVNQPLDKLATFGSDGVYRMKEYVSRDDRARCVGKTNEPVLHRVVRCRWMIILIRLMPSFVYIPPSKLHTSVYRCSWATTRIALSLSSVQCYNHGYACVELRS
jgi:hypothetical protein